MGPTGTKFSIFLIHFSSLPLHLGWAGIEFSTSAVPAFIFTSSTGQTDFISFQYPIICHIHDYIVLTSNCAQRLHPLSPFSTYLSPYKRSYYLILILLLSILYHHFYAPINIYTTFSYFFTNKVEVSTYTTGVILISSFHSSTIFTTF